MKKKKIQLSHSQIEQALTCPLSYKFRVLGRPTDVIPPPLTGEGTEEHRRIENAIKAKAHYWIPPPETETSPKTDIKFLHGAMLETSISIEIKDLGITFKGIIDVLKKGLTVDFKNAGDPSLKDSHRRQFDRYEVLKMLEFPELMNDDGTDDAYVFFLQHSNPMVFVHNYLLSDLDELMVALINDCKVCLSIMDAPLRDCRARPDWLCNYCSYPAQCSKAGGISKDMAKLLTTEKGREAAVARLLAAGAEYDGLKRSLAAWVNLHGPIELHDGRKWGRSHQRSKKLNQRELFSLGCRCDNKACLPWVMLSMQPDLTNAEKLAKGNKTILEALIRAGYEPDRIKEMVELAQNVISYQDGRAYYGFLRY